MTRTIVYATALLAFVAGKTVAPATLHNTDKVPATAMTFTAIFVPDWITYAVDSPSGGHYTKSIGLHRSCSSTSGTCIHFPQKDDCSGTDRYFCSMWRSVGFLMSFAAVLELATIVTYVLIIGGGKQKREKGWKLLSFMLVLVGVVQCGAMAIVVCALSIVEACC